MAIEDQTIVLGPGERFFDGDDLHGKKSKRIARGTITAIPAPDAQQGPKTTHPYRRIVGRVLTKEHVAGTRIVQWRFWPWRADDNRVLHVPKKRH